MTNTQKLSIRLIREGLAPADAVREGVDLTQWDKLEGAMIALDTLGDGRRPCRNGARRQPATFQLVAMAEIRVSLPLHAQRVHGVLPKGAPQFLERKGRRHGCFYRARCIAGKHGNLRSRREGQDRDGGASRQRTRIAGCVHARAAARDRRDRPRSRSLLEKKPGALDQAAPLRRWKLDPAFDTLRRLLEARFRYVPPTIQLGGETVNALTFELDQSPGAGQDDWKIEREKGIFGHGGVALSWVGKKDASTTNFYPMTMTYRARQSPGEGDDMT